MCTSNCDHVGHLIYYTIEANFPKGRTIFQSNSPKYIKRNKTLAIIQNPHIIWEVTNS